MKHKSNLIPKEKKHESHSKSSACIFKRFRSKVPTLDSKKIIRVALDSNVFVPEGLNADESFFLHP